MSRNRLVILGLCALAGMCVAYPMRVGAQSTLPITAAQAKPSTAPSTVSSKDALASARSLMLGGDLNQALAAYQRVLADYPQTDEAVRAAEMVAVICQRLGRVDDAIASWTTLIAKSSDDSIRTRAIRNIARLYSGARRYGEGVSALQRIADQYRSSLLWSVCQSEAGRLMYATGDPVAMLRYWRHSSKGVPPKYEPAFVSAIVSTYMDNHAYALGVKALDAVAAEQPRAPISALAMLEKGKLLDVTGDMAGALRAYLSAIDRSPDSVYGADAVVFAKNVWLGCGDPSSTLERLKRISAHHVTTRAAARADLCRCEVLVSLGDVGQARVILGALGRWCVPAWDEDRDRRDLSMRIGPTVGSGGRR